MCITSASLGRIEARIVMAASDAICDDYEVEIVKAETMSMATWAKLWRAVRNCDILMVHSPFLLSIPSITMGKLLRRKIIGFLWDDYPVLISGRRYDNSMRRRLFDWIENWAVNRIDTLLVPSPDFKSVAKYRHAVFLPFWRRSSRPTPHPHPKVADARVSLLFAGQINRTRGIEQALVQLGRLTDGDFVLRIASPDRPGRAISKHPNVDYLGHLTQSELAVIAQQCDAGLVSLHPHFDGVGFPSKTFDYLSWSLPLLFAGKSYPWMTGLAEDIGIGLDANKLDRLSLDNLRSLRIDFGSKRDRFEHSTCLQGDSLKAMIEKV